MRNSIKKIKGAKNPGKKRSKERGVLPQWPTRKVYTQGRERLSEEKRAEQNPYQKWHFFPGKEGIYKGRSPHGAFLKVYVNELAYKAAIKDLPMPDGAIIVKENYGKDKKTLMAVTPMYKVKGYNPDAGDWFWAKYGPDGKVMAAGKIKGCIRCHGVKKNEDWRYLHYKRAE